jgi:hypothetical protein
MEYFKWHSVEKSDKFNPDLSLTKIWEVWLVFSCVHFLAIAEERHSAFQRMKVLLIKRSNLEKKLFCTFFKLNFVPTYFDHRRSKATHLFQCKMVFNTSLWMYRISFFLAYLSVYLQHRFRFKISRFVCTRWSKEMLFPSLKFFGCDHLALHKLCGIRCNSSAARHSANNLLLSYSVTSAFLAKKRVENIRCILIRWLLEN